MNATRRFVFSLCIGAIVVSCTTEPPTSSGPSPELDLRQTLTGLIVSEWAPVILQDTDEGGFNPFGEPENGDGAADFITKFDYDGNWDAWDNWDNLITSQLSAYVYTSTAETEDFWFVTYNFFHPRDWCHGKNQPAPWGICAIEAEWSPRSHSAHATGSAARTWGISRRRVAGHAQ